MRRYLSLICAALMVCGLAGCSAKPLSSWEATRWLSSQLVGDFTLLSKEADASDSENPATTFRYADQDGREFWVRSAVHTSTWVFTTKDVTNTTNYLFVWYDSRRGEMDAALTGYPHNFSMGGMMNSGALTVTMPCRFDELAGLSQTLADLLNQMGSPLKDIPSPADNIIFNTSVTIECSGDFLADPAEDQRLESFTFPRQGATVTEEDIHHRLVESYVGAVRRGDLTEKLPDQVLQSVPPTELSLMVGSEAFGSLEYNAATDEYYTTDLLFTALYGSRKGLDPKQARFQQIVEALGGRYTASATTTTERKTTTPWVYGTERTSTADATWTIGPHTWTARQTTFAPGDDNQGHALPLERTTAVTQDGALVELSDPSDLPSSPVVAFRPSDIEKLLSVTVTLDFVAQQAVVEP